MGKHSFTHTVFMKTRMKSLFFLLTATAFACNGCQTPPAQENTSSHENSADNSFFPLDEILSDEPFTDDFKQEDTRPESDDVWNVDDVDISAIDKNRKLISFTFDDAPTRYLENIFAVFASFNEDNPDCKASATYFFNGRLFDNENFSFLHSAIAMGFELGNHTYSHFDLTSLTDDALQSEIQRVDDILQRADGKPYHLLRAPYGKINDTVKNTAPAPLIDWTIDTVDWTGVSADNIYNTVMENCFSGAIVLFHDGYPHTIEALKRLLPDLKDKGYQIVSVSQMAKTHGCTLRKGKVYIRARKQA